MADLLKTSQVDAQERSYRTQRVFAPRPLVDHRGPTSYNLLFLPWVRSKDQNTGFAFINFLTGQGAALAVAALRGRYWPDARNKEIEVRSAVVQGFEANMSVRRRTDTAWHTRLLLCNGDRGQPVDPTPLLPTNTRDTHETCDRTFREFSKSPWGGGGGGGQKSIPRASMSAKRQRCLCTPRVPSRRASSCRQGSRPTRPRGTACPRGLTLCRTWSGLSAFPPCSRRDSLGLRRLPGFSLSS